MAKKKDDETPVEKPDRGEKRSRERAEKVRDAFKERRKKKPRDEADVAITVATPDGDVDLVSVEYKTDPETGIGYVEVMVDSPTSQDPSYRIVNPPTYVEDPMGEVVLGDGKRYRDDPVAALAHTIAMNGGARR